MTPLRCKLCGFEGGGPPDVLAHLDDGSHVCWLAESCAERKCTQAYTAAPMTDLLAAAHAGDRRLYAIDESGDAWLIALPLEGGRVRVRCVTLEPHEWSKWDDADFTIATDDEGQETAQIVRFIDAPPVVNEQVLAVVNLLPGW